MKDELDQLILAYRLFYGFTQLQAIKAIKQDLSEMARQLKPVRL